MPPSGAARSSWVWGVEQPLCFGPHQSFPPPAIRPFSRGLRDPYSSSNSWKPALLRAEYALEPRGYSLGLELVGCSSPPGSSYLCFNKKSGCSLISAPLFKNSAGSGCGLRIFILLPFLLIPSEILGNQGRTVFPLSGRQSPGDHCLLHHTAGEGSPRLEAHLS